MRAKVLFQATIDNWADWGNAFQSTALFLPVVQAIFAKHDFAVPSKLDNVTPGTNAVFRVGDIIIKIFAPEETGIGDDGQGMERELVAQRFTEAQGITVPKVLANGVFRDAYVFRYIISSYVEGACAKQVFSHMSAMEKRTFGNKMRGITDALHIPMDVLPMLDLYGQAVHNERWRGIPHTLKEELLSLPRVRNWRESTVFVHGDLNEDNILMDACGDIALIDFGDAMLAPAYYELPPVIFETFREDKELVKGYLEGWEQEVFLEDLVCGLALHDFGGDILLQFFYRQGIPPAHITCTAKLKELLEKTLF